MLTLENIDMDGDPNIIFKTPQLCFGIDYDFADHKCQFHTSVSIYTQVVAATGDLDVADLILQGIPGGIVCLFLSDDDVPRQPQNLVADSSVVNIVICKYEESMFKLSIIYLNLQELIGLQSGTERG